MWTSGTFFELYRDSLDTRSESVKEQLAKDVNEFVSAHEVEVGAFSGDSAFCDPTEAPWIKALGESWQHKISDKLVRLPDKVFMSSVCLPERLSLCQLPVYLSVCLSSCLSASDIDTMCGIVCVSLPLPPKGQEGQGHQLYSLPSEQESRRHVPSNTCFLA
jgi:hypothetical protein